MSKVLVTLIIAIMCIILFPIGIGIIGGVFGIVFGVFGAVLGAIGGIIGSIFGAIFGVFGSFFESIFGWHSHGFYFHHSRNLVSIIVLAIIIGLIIKQRNASTK